MYHLIPQPRFKQFTHPVRGHRWLAGSYDPVAIEIPQVPDQPLALIARMRDHLHGQPLGSTLGIGESQDGPQGRMGRVHGLR